LQYTNIAVYLSEGKLYSAYRASKSLDTFVREIIPEAWCNWILENDEDKLKYEENVIESTKKLENELIMKTAGIRIKI
jgi:hypothetical protein